MSDWLELFKHDPISALLSSDNHAVIYFVRRDLLEEQVPPISYIWNLAEVQQIMRKQQPDGSWKYRGKKQIVYPAHHYALLETWKQFRVLIKHYELTKEHPVGEKAAEFLFSCQTPEGDIRGMIGNQYATYYTGAILGLLIKAGYTDDPRTERGMKWLLSMRQNDGGWTVPILTHKFNRTMIYRLTSQNMKPIEGDRTKPFSHNWTDMVLRAFAEHPRYRTLEAIKIAARLLKSRFFLPDVYSSYQAASYWVRFIHWWPNLLTALNSLSFMGYSKGDPDINQAISWFVNHQEPNGLWKLTYAKKVQGPTSKKTKDTQLWLSLAICKVLKRLYSIS